MARKLKADQWLFLATLLLVGFSVVIVYSASAVLADQRFNQPHLFLIKQAMWAAAGLAVLRLVMKIDYRYFRQPAFVWILVGVSTMALAAVLFGRPVNGARRWFNIGLFGVQPSELTKLAAIVFTAALLERRMHQMDEPWKALAPIGILAAVWLGLILFEPDFGSAMALLLIVCLMIFAAGLGYRYLLGIGLCLVPLVLLVLVAAPYRRQRLLAFWNPWEDPLDSGFHVIQSLIAVGTGGITGKGLMAGVQKLFYLPEPHTDFIFAVVAEELGLMGVSGVIICFGVIAWRGLRAAARAPDAFGALLAIGLTTMVVLQALVNMSVVVGLLPTKGTPLPFVSAGGSSLLISLVGMGMLLNVSQHGSASG